jgi:hypothetical protein
MVYFQPYGVFSALWCLQYCLPYIVREVGPLVPPWVLLLRPPPLVCVVGRHK